MIKKDSKSAIINLVAIRNIVSKLSIFFKKKADYLISYCMVVIPRIVYICFFAVPIRLADELYLFYLPAKLAGLDWSSSMWNYRYYGYGFSIFLVPLFKLIKDPVCLYRIVLVLTAIIEGSIPIIICCLLKKILGLTDRKIVVSVAVSCSYAVSVTSAYMYNEHIYTVYVWGCFVWVALLLKYNENRRKKIIYSIMLGLNMVLALTVHQRAVTLLLGFVFLYICAYWLYRKTIGYIWLIVPLYLAGTWADKKIMAWIIEFIKGVQADVGKIQNTGVDFTVPRAAFSDEKFIHAIARIGVGQMNTLNLATVGVGVFSIVLILYLIAKSIRRREDARERYLCLWGIFGLGCVAVTIAGQAFSWGPGVEKAWIDGNSRADSLRALNYLRYLYAYFPPVMMASLAYWYQKPSISRKLSRYGLLASILLILIWLWDIVPFVQNERAQLCKQWSFTRFLDRKVTIADYYMVVLVVMTGMMLLFILLHKKKIRVAMLVYSSFLLYYYFFQILEGDGAAERWNYHYADASYELIQDIQTVMQKNVIIYVRKEDMIPYTRHRLSYQIQFMNMRVKLRTEWAELPAEDIDEAVYITIEPQKVSQLSEQGYILYQLDDNEYAYVKGADIIEYMNQTRRQALIP